MYIPFDEELQFHPEFDDFHVGLKTKQADAILAGYPLMYNMTKQVLVIFLASYAARLLHIYYLGYQLD